MTANIMTTIASMTSNASMTSSSSMTSGLQEFHRLYSNVHGYAAIIVCLWGSLANIVNIIVLTRPKMTSATNLILTGLAIADLLKMASYLPFGVNFYIMRDSQLPFPSTLSRFWAVYLIFFINFSVACHTAAMWLTVTLAIFRYLYIYFPTRGSKHCSRPRARMAILAICASTVIVCIPNYMSTNIQKIDLTETNTTSESDHSTSYYTVKDDTCRIATINYWIHALLFKLIPCVLLTSLTFLLIVAMHRVNIRRIQLQTSGHRIESRRQTEANRTTAMLLAVVALFLVHELPHGVLALCNIFIENFYEDVYANIGDLLDMLALLCNSINFILYCSMSKLFKETFNGIFCRCFGKRRSNLVKCDMQWIKLDAVVMRSPETSNPYPTML